MELQLSWSDRFLQWVALRFLLSSHAVPASASSKLNVDREGFNLIAYTKHSQMDTA